MAETLAALMVGHPDVHFRYTHKTDAGAYVFSSRSGEFSPAGLQPIAGIKRDIRSGIARVRRKL
jgi:hypothetical protein